MQDFRLIESWLDLIRGVRWENIGRYKLKIIIQSVRYLVLVMVLSSCVQNVTTETKRPQPSGPFTPTLNSIPTNSSTAIVTPDIISHMPYEQVYVDPTGQYALKFSADWKPTDKPNSFAGDEGFFETGYLPNWGFVSRGINVCVWLA